jgi:hypothetical protein
VKDGDEHDKKLFTAITRVVYMHALCIVLRIEFMLGMSKQTTAAYK